MNYFTPTQQRIALVETAQYNQKLLALRARRLAQQRMDYSHRIARHQQDELMEIMEQDINEDDIKTINLGPAVHLTENSDDESYEMDEIFAPVPYQKGYWLAAQRAQQKKISAQAKAQQIQQIQHHQRQQKKSLAAQSAAVNKQARALLNKSNTNSNNKKLPAMPGLDNKPSSIQRSVSSTTHNRNTNTQRSSYQYQYGNPRPHSSGHASYSHTTASHHNPYQQQKKTPQYRPASQHHPGLHSKKNQYQYKYGGNNKKPGNGG
eukprot:CAMPEP_0201572256 /NCGR_PEP_ID=MMETSP0190_2-20130828/15411_1 /ASSEMBLY_ACC=CAM_ASM_000263 /TAXON_ID=37353 /ORGANISM="Rosalina sp." /LENGTH=262 /DNA_ID=CAMNT_0047997773 /DNA_START=41 /DNA_END=825 /DNA_ORIENTATION=+